MYGLQLPSLPNLMRNSFSNDHERTMSMVKANHSVAAGIDNAAGAGLDAPAQDTKHAMNAKAQALMKQAP